ncbi:MAG: RNA 3'-terminal phosphate cyclase [Planctomycetes bacterium]|nr:RNA 3'-terminal phosphate cyclase [Planctomycetota bacterium]
MLTIDGSFGEGGGQILRTALGLSLVTGTPFRIEKIRARRKNPGLLRQHLTAVQAAVEVGKADVAGATIGSKELAFKPAKVSPGSYAFAVGTAGSATLVLQTVLPPLLVAPGPSTLTLEGGTHNPWAPPYDFIEKAFAPLLGRMGPKISMTLQRRGFYPAGGGKFTVTVEPVSKLSRVELLKRGEVRAKRARAIVASLPSGIAGRELAVVQRALSIDRDFLHVEEDRSSRGPGNVLMIEIACEHVTEMFTGFGEVGVPAEAVADKVVEEVRRYLEAEAAVGPYLADQLLIPMALAGGGAFTTVGPTSHSTTNIEIIAQFLGKRIEMRPVTDMVHRVEV